MIALMLTLLSIIGGVIWLVAMSCTAGSVRRTFWGRLREHDAMRGLVFFFAVISEGYIVRSFSMPAYLHGLSDNDLLILAGLRVFSLLLACFAIGVTRAYGTGE